MTKTTLLFLFLAFGHLISLAQTGQMKVVPTADQETYKLYYSCDVPSDLSISIKNEEKSSVYKRKIKDKKGFILPLSFTDFVSGRYVVEIFSPLFTLRDTVNYVDFAGRIKGMFEWEVLAEKERVIITALEPLDDDVTVIINDSNGSEMDKQVLKGESFGMRVFAFDGADVRRVDVNIYYKGKFIDSRPLILQ